MSEIWMTVLKEIANGQPSWTVAMQGLAAAACQKIKHQQTEIERLANIVANYQPIVDAARRILTAAKTTFGIGDFPDIGNTAEDLGALLAGLKLTVDNQQAELDRRAELYREARAATYTAGITAGIRAIDWQQFQEETERNIAGGDV